MAEKQVGFFGESLDNPKEGLATRVVTAIHNCRDDMMREREPVTPSGGNEKTRLLFPFVSQSPGFDTGISIANTTADPFGTAPCSGTCTLHYYGRSIEPSLQGNRIATTSAAIQQQTKQTSAAIGPGEQLLFTLFAGDAKGLILPMPFFTGYLIVECNFPRARGFAFLSDLGAQKVAAGYVAEILP